MAWSGTYGCSSLPDVGRLKKAASNKPSAFFLHYILHIIKFYKSRTMGEEMLYFFILISKLYQKENNFIFWFVTGCGWLS